MQYSGARRWSSERMTCQGACFELVALKHQIAGPRVVVPAPVGRLVSASHRPKGALTWIKGASGRGITIARPLSRRSSGIHVKGRQARTYAASGIVLAVFG